MSIRTFRYGDRGTVISVSGALPALADRCWTREWNVSSSLDKDKIIGQLHGLFEGNDENHDFLVQRAELIVDEMLENALYSAPRDSDGQPLFIKGCQRELLDGEKLILRCAFDGKQLFLEVSDSWGNLSPETVEMFLSLNDNDTDPESDRAGRGLFIMWKFLDYFYVNINPGVDTTMGGVLSLFPVIV
ncbi:MAG: hypothetical protein V1791_06025 [Pseudomonadota bacterium]